MVEITKISSKGQVVIPQEIRERLELEEGDLLLFSEQGDSILLKKIKLPKVKKWEEATKPFRNAVKQSGFTKEDLEKVMEESRLN